MKIVSYLRNKCLAWSSSPKAIYLLICVSFLQAWCLPLALDFILIPMILAKPAKASRYIALAVLWVVLGGLCGYFLGKYFFAELLWPLINHCGYNNTFAQAMALFDKHGMFILILSGVIPLPYMFFTLTAGVMHLGLINFLLGCLLGRTLRYGGVGLLLKSGFNIKAFLCKKLKKLT